MFKFEFKDLYPILIVLSIFLLVLAVIGKIPLNNPIELELWMRYIFGGFALCLILIAILFSIFNKDDKSYIPTSSDYQQRLRLAQKKFEEITPEHKILAEKQFGRANFLIINESITEAKTEIIVSSDDNHFSASGGVAKAILNKAGKEVSKELERYRTNNFKQGDIVITTSGKWGCRAIIHPALINLEENRYPDANIIKMLVQNCIQCAIFLGAKSISFPVLGGGTASKHLDPKESVKIIYDEIVSFLKMSSESRNELLTHVSLYIFDKKDAEGLSHEIAE